jgi:carbon-monoxide dehydrogenase medium subunit
MLNGKKATDSVIAEIKAVIPEEISPITDIRSTQEYRTHMMQIMFERGMKKAISQLSGGNYA